MRRALSALVLAVLVGCAVAQGSAAPESRRQVVIGMNQEPDVLNSVLTSTGASNFVMKALMNFPTYYDPNWQIRPGIVETIPTLDNGWRLLPGGKMRLIWKLRHGVKWSDGQDVTAADLTFTAAVARNPAVGSTSTFNCGFGDKVEAVEAIDPYTVAVTWKTVYPFANICVYDGGLLPRHVLEATYNADPAKLKQTDYGREPRATVSDGPYVLKSWTRGSEIVLEANPYYWRGRPPLDRVVFKFFSDANAMLASLVSGDVDLLPSGFIGLSFGSALQLEDLIRQGQARNVKVEYGPSLLFESLTLNLDNPILKSKAVRQAMAYATNRDAISQSLFKGKQIPAYSPVPPSQPGFNGGVNRYPYDLKKAQALLDAAGWKVGPDGIRRNVQGEKLSIKITTTAGNKDREREEQILQESWRQAGIDLIIENFPARVVFGSMVYQRKFEGIVLQSNGFSRPEASFEGYVSSSIKPVGEFSLNYLGWRNSQVDELANEYNRELSAAKRTALLRRFQQLWADELPEISLYWYAAATAYDTRLTGYRPVGLASYPEPATWNIYEWRWK